MIKVKPLIGLVGCGRWGKNILRDLIALGCQVAVVAPCLASRENATWGKATFIVDRVDDLPSAAGYIVASPAATHARVIVELLPRRVPIFCEKPLTVDVESARWLAGHAADRVFVMDKWRYHPGILELARISRSGELGQVVGLKTYRLGWSLPQADVDCAWTLLPHELTIALEVLGHIPLPRQACAERAPDGMLLSLKARLGDAVWHRTEIGSVGPARRRSAELLCSHGTAILPDAESNHILLSRTSALLAHGKPLLEQRPVCQEQPLLTELRVFLKHLSGGPAPRSSTEEGLAVVETIDQLRRLAGLDIQPQGERLTA